MRVLQLPPISFVLDSLFAIETIHIEFQFVPNKVRMILGIPDGMSCFREENTSYHVTRCKQPLLPIAVIDCHSISAVLSCSLVGVSVCSISLSKN